MKPDFIEAAFFYADAVRLPNSLYMDYSKTYLPFSLLVQFNQGLITRYQFQCKEDFDPKREFG